MYTFPWKVEHCSNGIETETKFQLLFISHLRFFDIFVSPIIDIYVVTHKKGRGRKGSIGGTNVNHEAAELELFGSDDVMVTRLLGQLHDSATCSEPQTGHVRFAADTKKLG